MKPRFALLLLAAVTGVSCDCGATKAMKKRPATRVATGPVAAPGGAWKSATIEIRITSETHTPSGRNLPIPMTTWTVQPWLVLEGASDPVRIALAAGTGNSFDEPSLAKAADAAWKLSWAPDGRGVACLEEGAEGWLWVCCDAGRPFHPSRFTVASASDPDAASKGPRFRDLALKLMKPDPKEAEPALDAYGWREIAGVISASKDEELFFELFRAALREKSGLFLAGLDRPDLARIQAAVTAPPRPAEEPPGPREYLDWKEGAGLECRQELRRPASAGSVVASNAALLLGRSTRPGDQRALAAALGSKDWAPPSTVVRDLQWPNAVAWSLAGSIDASGAIPEDVEASMLAFIAEETAKPEAALAVLYALATHGSAKAKTAITAMASESEGKEAPAWPASLDELWQVGMVDHGALTHSLQAWAKAAPK